MFAKRHESSPKGLLDPQNSFTHSPNRKPAKGPAAHRHLPPGVCSLLRTRHAELRIEESEVDAEHAPLRASPEPGSPWGGRSRCALAL